MKNEIETRIEFIETAVQRILKACRNADQMSFTKGLGSLQGSVDANAQTIIEDLNIVKELIKKPEFVVKSKFEI